MSYPYFKTSCEIIYECSIDVVVVLFSYLIFLFQERMTDVLMTEICNKTITIDLLNYPTIYLGQTGL